MIKSQKIDYFFYEILRGLFLIYKNIYCRKVTCLFEKGMISARFCNRAYYLFYLVICEVLLYDESKLLNDVDKWETELIYYVSTHII